MVTETVIEAVIRVPSPAVAEWVMRQLTALLADRADGARLDCAGIYAASDFDAPQPGDAELPGKQLVLGIHHVANGKAGKLHPGLPGAVRGRSGQAVADRVSAHDEVARGIQRLALPDQKIKAVMIARQRSANQHCVRLVAVELTVSDVRLAVIPDHFAGFELQVSKLRHAVRRVDPARLHRRIFDHRLQRP